MISGNVFGGGNNADVTGNTTITVGNKNITSNPDLFIEHSIYGGGNLGSVGTIISQTKHESLDNGFGLSWPYEFEYAPNTGKTTINLYGGRIGLSGKDYFGPRNADGKPIAINPDGSQEHVLNNDEINALEIDNGDVYGGSKGQIGTGNTENIEQYRYAEALLYNVRETEINIEMPTPNPDDIGIIIRKENKVAGKDETAKPKPSLKLETGLFGIAGSVYGGGEDGHVYENTTINIKGGYVGHAIYGGGKGKGMFKTTLNNIAEQGTHTEDVYSWTAGKVYGNTTINMDNGWVMRSIFGGGNLGSVGKGNYAGGADDYYSEGYGETLTGNLWDNVSDESQAFLNSGKATVNINGGKIGFLLSSTTKVYQAYNADATTVGNNYADYLKACTKDDLPTGNVFGASRGQAVAYVTNDYSDYTFSPGLYLGYVNETEVNIGKPAVGDTPASGPVILGSVYGGSMDGHVRRDTKVTVYKGEIGIPYNDINKTIMGNVTTDDMQWLHRGNVYGAGSGIGKYEDGNTEKNSIIAGSVTHSTMVDIKSGIDGNAGGIIYRDVYGGGSLASVGSPVVGPDAYRKGDTAEGHGIGKQTIAQVDIAGTIGHADSYAKRYAENLAAATDGADVSGYGGDVNGGSRGDATLDNFATAYHTQVNILPGAHILNNAFGGGEAGLVRIDAKVEMTGGTIDGNMFGGGDMADVNGNTYIDMSAGHIMRNIYGGGKMGSVGTITNTVMHKEDAASDGALFKFALSWPVEFTYKAGTGDTHVNVTGGRIGTSGDDNGDVYGGGMGRLGIDWAAKGIDIDNSSDDPNLHDIDPSNDEDVARVIKIIDDYRYEEASIANVNNTYVNVNFSSPASLDNIVKADKIWDTDDKEPKIKLLIDVGTYTFIYDNENDIENRKEIGGYFNSYGTTNVITGSVYGGSENGHVNGNTNVEMTDGIIGHAIYGGGKGKGTYIGRLYNLKNAEDNQYINYVLNDNFKPILNSYVENINSLTSGKVYGNTNITMKGGYVMRSVFGGGNLGSVGKGNYSGGSDDYSTIGYGELPAAKTDPLWTSNADGDFAYHFMNSGKSTVKIEAGQIGYILPADKTDAHKNIEKLARKDGLPTGNVFGACRGIASPNGNVSPRYLYIPDFFLGYVNETEVIIGTESSTPKILGSVYGGGQDGHVRRSTNVVINNAEIGIPYTDAYRQLLNKNNELSDEDITNIHWVGRGNVFGAGSGIGSYEVKDPVTGIVKDKDGNPVRNSLGVLYEGKTEDDAIVDYNYSSGSVTGTTKVTINNAQIHQNVYGGGSLASIGPPQTGQGFDEYKTNDESYPTGQEHVSTSSTNIIINGGTIGDSQSYAKSYGGNIYGASRGNITDLNLGNVASRYATVIWTDVKVNQGHIFGNIFGGGESGAVKQSTNVVIGGKVVESSGSHAPVRTVPAPAANVNSSVVDVDNSGSIESNFGGQSNAATEAPQNRSINRTRVTQ